MHENMLLSYLGSRRLCRNKCVEDEIQNALASFFSYQQSTLGDMHNPKRKTNSYEQFRKLHLLKQSSASIGKIGDFEVLTKVSVSYLRIRSIWSHIIRITETRIAK